MTTEDTHGNQPQLADKSADHRYKGECTVVSGRRSGGLLSSYSQPLHPHVEPGRQESVPPNQQFKPVSEALGSSVASPTASSYTRSPQSTGLLSRWRHPSTGLLLPSIQQADVELGNVMRNWSGHMAAISSKLATLAGHKVRPPAPYMERYRPPTSNLPVAPPIVGPFQPWRRSRVMRTAILMRHRRQRWLGSRRLLPTMLGFLAVLMMLAGFASTVYGYAYYESQLPRLQELANQHISQTTRIYDRSGKKLFEIFDQKEGRRTPVTYQDIPAVMRDAQIAVEDETFWSNPGIDPQGIVRAAIGYVRQASIQGGGSTITQQVIKNLTGHDEATFTRKIPEAALALGMTQQYPKWKILEMYFNVAPYGPLDLGIESAVEEYFHLMPMCKKDFTCTPGIARLNMNLKTGKNDPLLGLARASLLAGLPQNPPAYYPAGSASQRQHALHRQRQVLGRMIEQKVMVEGLGVVTPALARKVEALTAKMKFTTYNQHRVKYAPHFVDWIMAQVEMALGNGDPARGVVAFNTGGFNIRTTISLELENYVERAVRRHLEGPSMGVYADGLPLKTAHNVNTGAVVVLNARTGEILAMDGSLDYNDDDVRVMGQFNAADPPPNADGSAPGRPPGSTFKPFVYATAFEMGWYPGMAVSDYRTYFPRPGQGAGALVPQRPEDDGPAYMYAPPDYNQDGEWSFSNNQPATIRLALQESLNIGAMKAMKYAGAKNVRNMVHRLGLTQINRNDIAWALGTENVTVLQMTSAYQTFANGGVRVPPQGVLDIWDNYGHHLYHYDPATAVTYRVMSPQVAFLVTSILTDELSRAGEFGQDHVLSFADVDPRCAYLRACAHPVAAKTGTTDQFRDTWTIGYTPDVVVGTWTGNADGEPMHDVIGISGAAPIWHSVIEAASGYCGASGDGIPCPDHAATFPHKVLGLGTEQLFKIPPGVSRHCTAYYSGLVPLPGERTDCDWIIDGQSPMQR